MVSIFGHVIEGQDGDAVAQGDKLESLEIVRVGEEAQKWNAIESFCRFKSSFEKAAFLKQNQAKMETLAAGFEKQKGGLRYQFIQRMEKQAGRNSCFITKVH
jgi:peptidyl-prolyl cis-trans isomerase A (cyclophilin A)